MMFDCYRFRVVCLTTKVKGHSQCHLAESKTLNNKISVTFNNVHF